MTTRTEMDELGRSYKAQHAQMELTKETSMKTRREHFVTFDSPGTMFAESTTKPIGSWDIAEAVRLSADIVERYGAKPYGFRFSTEIVADPVPDGEGGTLAVQGKEVARSGMHFLGGSVFSLDEVPVTDGNRILRDNMRSNGWWYVVMGANGYRWTQPFEADAVVVSSVTCQVIERGDDPARVAYRAEKTTARDAEYARMREADKAVLVS
jgi:hypothetical protein